MYLLLNVTDLQAAGEVPSSAHQLAVFRTASYVWRGRQCEQRRTLLLWCLVLLILVGLVVVPIAVGPVLLLTISAKPFDVASLATPKAFWQPPTVAVPGDMIVSTTQLARVLDSYLLLRSGRSSPCGGARACSPVPTRVGPVVFATTYLARDLRRIVLMYLLDVIIFRFLVITISR